MPVGKRFVTKDELETLSSNLMTKIRGLRNAILKGLGVTQFIDLLDVSPTSYVDQTQKIVRVKSEEDGVEFGPAIYVSDSAPTPADGEDGDIWIEY